MRRDYWTRGLELNETVVDEIVSVDCLDSIREVIPSRPLARHGGCDRRWPARDGRSLDRILGFDVQRGTIEVEAGV